MTLQKKNGNGRYPRLKSCGTVIPQRDFSTKNPKSPHGQTDKTPPRTRTPMCAPPQGQPKVKVINKKYSCESMVYTTIRKILIDKFDVRKWLYYKMR